MAKFTEYNSTRNNKNNGNSASLAQNSGRSAAEQASYQANTANTFAAAETINFSYAYDNEGQHSYLSNGASTDDVTPSIVGTATPNSIVYIEDNGQVIGSAKADYYGSWQFTPKALSAGEHNFVFKAGTASSEPFVLNIEAPKVVIEYAYDNEGQHNYLGNGSSTDDVTPSFVGKALANSIVYIEDNGQVIGSAKADYYGSWQFTPKALSAGEHNFMFKAGTASSEPFVLNIEAPKVVIEYAYDNEGQYNYLSNGASTDDVTPSFVGKALANSTVYIEDNGQLIGSAKADYYGSWQFTPKALSTGEHNFVFKTDKATSDAFSLTILSKADLPIIVDAVIDDVNGYNYMQSGANTDDNKPTFYGSAGSNTKLYAYDNGVLVGSTTADYYGQWRFTPTAALNDGSHAFVFSTSAVSASAGNVSKEFALTVAAPLRPVVIESVYDDHGDRSLVFSNGSTDDRTPSLWGYAKAGSIVHIYDNGVEIASVKATNGSWQFTPSDLLAYGAHSLVAKAADHADSQAFKFTVIESLFPIEPIATLEIDGAFLVASSNTKPGSAYVISGAGEPGSVVYIYDNNTLLGSTLTSSSTGRWKLSIDDLAGGQHNLVAKSGDSISEGYTFTSDAGTVEPPVPPVPETPVTLDKISEDILNNYLLQNGSITNDATPKFAGKAEAGAIINIYDNNVLIASVIAGADGTWSYQTSTDLSEGKHSIVAQSGGSTSLPFSFTVLLPTGQQSKIDWVRQDTGKGGFIGENDTTADDTLTFRGVSQPNTLVAFSIDGEELLVIRTNSGGGWEFTPSTAVENGAHTFTAKAVGETDGVSFKFNVEVPVRINFVTGEEAGGVNDGGESQDVGFTILGNGPRGAVVYLYDGEKLLGSATATDDKGIWKVIIKDLPAGEHDLIAKAGEVASEAFTFTTIGETPVEPVEPPPEVTPATLDMVSDDFNSTGTVNRGGAIEQGGTSRTYQPTFSGSAAANSVVVIYDNNAAIGSTMSDAAGEWSFKPTQSLLGEQHSITVAATGGEQSTAFNYSQFGRVWIAAGIEDDLGVGQFDDYLNNVITDSRPEFIGQGIPGSVVTLELSGTTVGSTLVDAAGSWHFQMPDHLKYVSGGYELVAKSAGLRDSLPFDFEIKHPEDTDINFGKAYSDNDGLVQIVNTGSTDDTTPLFHGTAGFDIVVQFFDNGVAIGSTQAGPDGKWTFQPELAVGAHSLSAKAGDYQETYIDFRITITAKANAFAFAIEDVLNDGAEMLFVNELQEEPAAAPLTLTQQQLTVVSTQGITVEHAPLQVQPLEDDFSRF